MTKLRNSKHRFDLEKRTLNFAISIRDFVKEIHYSIANREYTKQIIRSSGSVGANYIEANEALSKKDFIHKMKMCRKEVKETRYWMLLISIEQNKEIEIRRDNLIKESTELLYIFTAIITKSL